MPLINSCWRTHHQRCRGSFCTKRQAAQHFLFLFFCDYNDFATVILSLSVLCLFFNFETYFTISPLAIAVVKMFRKTAVDLFLAFVLSQKGGIFGRYYVKITLSWLYPPSHSHSYAAQNTNHHYIDMMLMNMDSINCAQCSNSSPATPETQQPRR